MRAASPECTELQHSLPAPHPPLGPASRALPDLNYSNIISIQTEEPDPPPYLYNQRPVQTHHHSDSRVLRVCRIGLGQRLLLEQPSLAVHTAHQAVLPQRCSRRPPFPLPGQQPQHIPVLLPRGRGLGMEGRCEAGTVEGMEGRRAVGFRPLVGLYGRCSGGQTVCCAGKWD